MRHKKIGNINDDKFLMACFLCGKPANLSLIAYRAYGTIRGWVIGCEECTPKLLNKFLELKEEKK